MKLDQSRGKYLKVFHLELTTPPPNSWKRDPVPTVQNDRWTQERVWTRKYFWIPPRFEHRTVQVEARLCAGYAIPAPTSITHSYYFPKQYCYFFLSIEVHCVACEVKPEKANFV